MNSSRILAIVLVVVVLLGAGTTVALYVISRGNGSTSTSTTLPAGCTKPPDGFLVIASESGYNDSIDHGVPAKSWPILNVTQGQTVNITVCNIDFQAHGFNVAHYYASSILSVAPGTVVHLSFVASEAGDFQIYCEIFCSIHWAMQSGLLHVTPA